MLNIHASEFFALFIVCFAAGKLLQQGGVFYGQGRDWIPLTLLGTLLEIVAFGTVLILALERVKG